MTRRLGRSISSLNRLSFKPDNAPGPMRVAGSQAIYRLSYKKDTLGDDDVKSLPVPSRKPHIFRNPTIPATLQTGCMRLTGRGRVEVDLCSLDAGAERVPPVHSSVRYSARGAGGVMAVLLVSEI